MHPGLEPALLALLKAKRELVDKCNLYPRFPETGSDPNNGVRHPNNGVRLQHWGLTPLLVPDPVVRAVSPRPIRDRV